MEVDGAVGDDEVVTADMIKQEESLQNSSRVEEEKMRSQAQREYQETVDTQRYQRLKFLLDRTKIYSDFLKQKLQAQQEAQRSKADKDAEKKAKSTQATSDAAVAGTKSDGEGEEDAAVAKRETRRRKSEVPTTAKPAAKEKPARQSAKRKAVDDGKYMLADYVGEDGSKRARNETKTSVHDEAAAPKREAIVVDGVVASERQPRLLTGGILREYQLAGVEWLVSLWENGLNGILADEMGLGKTIQCIAFACHLLEQGIKGPFLIATPLSTLSNWVTEFRRFAPSVPVILYHGPIDQRASLRRKMGKLTTLPTGTQCYPVVITSYEIVMNDRKYLQGLMWKYIIVDEGHRIKNLNCRLIRELKSYRSANRLLLTGTPLQNNLAELWSLLNFLLPDIFDDLENFQRWFDFSDVGDAEGDQRFVEREQRENVLSKLHHILQPFLLRRLKTDVEHFLPKKREIVVYAPYTRKQQEFYEAILNKTIMDMVGRADGESLATPMEIDGVAEDDSSKRASDEDDSVMSAGSAPQSSAEAPAQTPRTRRASKRLLTANANERTYKELSDRAYFKQLEESAEAPTSTTRSPIYRQLSNSTSVVSVKLQNVLMQLRKVCNHPYLLEYPLDAQGEFKVDEELVRCSGKMLLLDQLLPALRAEGHKVLVFSQMTTMLDILEDYLHLRGHRFCRLDGAVSLADRQEQIKAFNTDPDIFVFLLSTRAGGLGINLVSADTVVIYDSDWNPQVDMQAQDRCHRIGQTKPVMVYRLITANSIEQKILERATAKRKLEKIIIHKGTFRNPTQSSQAITGNDLLELLRAEESEKMLTVTSDAVLSETDLRRLLDRDHSAPTPTKKGQGRFRVVEESGDQPEEPLLGRVE